MTATVLSPLLALTASFGSPCLTANPPSMAAWSEQAFMRNLGFKLQEVAPETNMLPSNRSEARINNVAWRDYLAANARRLLALPNGWDGPGSIQINPAILTEASTLVHNVLEGLDTASAPSLVPGGDGSVQLEWHEKHGELELDLHPDGSSYIWGRIHSTGFEFEGENEKALALFYRWATWMASPQSNAGNVPLSPVRPRLTVEA